MSAQPNKPLTRTLSYADFATFDYAELWRIYTAQQNRIAWFEEEDRRKSKFVDDLLDQIEKLKKANKGNNKDLFNTL